MAPDWQFGTDLRVPGRRRDPRLARSPAAGTGSSGSAADGELTPIDLPFTEISSLAIDGDTVVLRAAGAATSRPVVELDAGRAR